MGCLLSPPAIPAPGLPTSYQYGQVALPGKAGFLAELSESGIDKVRRLTHSTPKSTIDGGETLPALTCGLLVRTSLGVRSFGGMCQLTGYSHALTPWQR
jgi:hypothetical protein